MEKPKIAIYPGSFDPVTNGHLDIINRALKIFDKLIIAVLDHPSKEPLFSKEERMEMLKQVTKDLDVEIDHFDGLLVEYVKQKNCNVIIRSLRAVSDFDFEFQMSVMNRKLNKSIETIFLMTDNEYFYLNSTMVKEIAKNKGKISCLVPEVVEGKLKEKFATLE